MKMAQKQKQHTAREEAPQEEAPEVPQKVSQKAEDMLAEIDCCLAENEADTEKALKARAKTEWDAMTRIPDYSERSRQRQIWEAKYADVISFMCCGTPIFDD